MTNKKKTSKSPSIPGYTVIRGDRKGSEYPGGGLLTLVKGNIGYKVNHHSQRGTVELLSVAIHQSGKKWLTVNNTYIPPKGEVDLSWIPVEPNSITAGDFNGHSQIWDDSQPCDSRGNQIVDWLLDNNLTCMNDGSPTRMNPGTGGMSALDITLVTPGLNTKMQWNVIDETDMGSDHLPIVFEINDGDVQTIDTTPYRTRWKSKNVDWKAFREEV